MKLNDKLFHTGFSHHGIHFAHKYLCMFLSYSTDDGHTDD